MNKPVPQASWWYNYFNEGMGLETKRTLGSESGFSALRDSFCSIWSGFCTVLLIGRNFSGLFNRAVSNFLKFYFIKFFIFRGIIPLKQGFES